MKGTSFFTSLYLVLFLLCATLLTGQSMGMDSVGSISGKITDANALPLEYANVVLKGTPWGAMTQQDGTFQIANVPVGVYDVAVMMLGYVAQTINVSVTGGQSARVEVRMIATAVDVLPPVEIVADRDKRLDKTGGSKGRFKGNDVPNYPVDDTTELIDTTPSAVVRGGEIHFRGDRADASSFTIDGVSVIDPLSGQNSAAPSTHALDDVVINLGGGDAASGGMSSGVDFKTKSGSDQYEGEIYYQTDDWGHPDNTFENLDRVSIGFGGPAPHVPGLTFYLSGEGIYKDGFQPPPKRDNPTWLNLISHGDRQNNEQRYQGKLSYKRGQDRFTFDNLYVSSRSKTFDLMWSRDGFVQTYKDTARTGEVRIRHGRWSPTPVDSTYLRYNAAEHTPTTVNHFRMTKATWQRTLGGEGFLSVKVVRNHYFDDQRVQGKEPWEYDGTALNRDFWMNYTDGASEPFFVINGDYPLVSTRRTAVYTTLGDLTQTIGNHRIGAGIGANYNDMYFWQTLNPMTSPDGQVGVMTRYHRYNFNGFMYAQEQWEHEGMVLNLGLRWEGLSLGNQLPLAVVQERWKTSLTPRIGVAYPISDRDAFSFFYGRYAKVPDSRTLYENTDAVDGRVRGNPNLRPQTTSSYQAGIQHFFDSEMLWQATVAAYYKDIFGLVTTEPVTLLNGVTPVSQYANKDYATARGFEASIKRDYRDGVGLEINYSFGVATGTASDPNARQTSNFTYVPISEQPLDWDVPHSLSVIAQLGDGNLWHVSMIWSYSSGFPYTPVSRNTRETLPETVNSRRLPATNTVDLLGQRILHLWGQTLKIAIEIPNALDAKNVVNPTPLNFPTPPHGGTQEYAAYLSETGKFGGAYLGEDTNGDGQGDWVPLHDPRVFGDPRAVRLGISFLF